MPHRFTQSRLQSAIRALWALRDEGEELIREHHPHLQWTHPNNRESLRNLLRYVAIRRHDIRDLQSELSRLGLSSLGRMEAHVLPSLNAVLAALHSIGRLPMALPRNYQGESDFDAGDQLLAGNTELALGTASPRHPVRIMVTLPAEAATQPDLVKNLLAASMNLARINCAHGSPESWNAMIRHVRSGAEETGQPCRILMDIAGPKLRTGPASTEEIPTLRWKPRRSSTGIPTRLARVHFGRDFGPEQRATGLCVPVELDDPVSPGAGDEMQLQDVRNRFRTHPVVGTWEGGWTILADRKSIVSRGCPVKLFHEGRLTGSGRIGELPPVERRVILHRGDTLIIRRGSEPGRPAVRDLEGRGSVSPRTR